MDAQEFEVVAPETKIALAAPQDKWDRLIQVMVEKNAGAEQLAIFVDSVIKARKEDARLQFEAALGRFRDHVPKVLKTKQVVIPNRDGSQTTYWHAELDKAFRVIDEELRKEGLVASWRPSEGANARTVMTCVFRHSASGHVEDMATLGGPPDTSGSKTPGQQIGSIAFYLQRYTLLAAAGVVPEGIDNDARSTEGMSEQAITDYSVQMEDCSDMESLRKSFQEARDKARSLNDKNGYERLRKVYESKKRELLEARQ